MLAFTNCVRIILVVWLKIRAEVYGNKQSLLVSVEAMIEKLQLFTASIWQLAK